MQFSSHRCQIKPSIHGIQTVSEGRLLHTNCSVNYYFSIWSSAVGGFTHENCLFSRVQADCTKSFKHSTVVCNPEHTCLIAGDEDGRMRVYRTSRSIPENQQPQKPLPYIGERYAFP